ncbi:hypothetical protein [Cytobacillus gottheilii]|uniref:hypothetical protein n=1 Tax=Cytobacillus gottheilii TaxID=859144 RepID=UPI001C561E58|nr:hypothetical protein [Cytobacillus gottheilii]
MKNDQTITNKAAQFRPGQIVSGKIIKHYPNQTAEVQIGGQKVIAQLETPLAANERYWFQVQNGEGTVHLKVLEGTGANGRMLTATPESLLQQFQLPVSKEHLSLLQFFTKEQLPLTAETFKQASEWLKNSHSEADGFQALREMFTRQLPFTKQVFTSLQAAFDQDSITALLQNLQKELSQTGSVRGMSQLTAAISTLTESFQEKAGKELLSQLMKQWLTSADFNKSSAAYKQLQTLGFLPADTIEGNALTSVIRTISEQLPAGKAEIASALSDVLRSNQPSERPNFIMNLTKLQDLMTEHGPQQELTNLLNSVRTNAIQLPIAANSLQKLIQPVLQQIAADVKDFGALLPHNQQLNNSTIRIGQQLLDGELPLLANNVQDSSLSVEESALFREQMKSIIKLLGLSHEHDAMQVLKQPNEDGVKNLDSIKSLLLSQLHDDLSPALRDAADKVVNRITGFQLLSQEIGPIQQYVYQIPFSFLGKVNDVTMQWSGRKTAEGKIDPDHCRILFYLNLDSLHETVVDLRVQARVINMAVINDTPGLQTVVQPFIPILKERLMEHDYKLSALEFKTSADKTQKPVQTSFLSQNQPKFSGLDIRI